MLVVKVRACLLVKLDCSIQVADTKHDLAERLTSGGPLNELELVTVGVFHEGDDRLASFHWPWLSGHLAALRLHYVHHLLNLQLPTPGSLLPT